MKYRQLSLEERCTLTALRREGYGIVAISERLGRHRSTLWRELGRNRSRHDGGYRVHQAQECTQARRRRSRRNQRFGQAELAQVEALLREEWSPEQIAGTLAREGTLRISHETIYRHVWKDKRQGGTLYQHLRIACRTRRKRYRSYERPGKARGQAQDPGAPGLGGAEDPTRPLGD